jgi:hypothetical protein
VGIFSAWQRSKLREGQKQQIKLQKQQLDATRAADRPVVPAFRTGEPIYLGYCTGCRGKRQFQGALLQTANGRRVAQGPCPTCGTTMNRILPRR